MRKKKTGDRIPQRIRRVSSMIAGAYCTLEINGKIVNRKVFYRQDRGLCIVSKNQFYYETELPLGEEVIL